MDQGVAVQLAHGLRHCDSAIEEIIGGEPLARVRVEEALQVPLAHAREDEHEPVFMLQNIMDMDDARRRDASDASVFVLEVSNIGDPGMIGE
jgi:hypothetical protein